MAASILASPRGTGFGRNTYQQTVDAQMIISDAVAA
jgi:hypothetical protein